MVAQLVFAPLSPDDLGVVKVGDIVLGRRLVPPPPVLHDALDQEVVVSIADLVLVSLVFLSLHNLRNRFLLRRNGHHIVLACLAVLD